MKLNPEQSKLLSDFLNKCESLPNEVAAFAEELKAEIVAEADAAKAAAEAEAERMEGLTDAEVVAEAAAAIDAAPEASLTDAPTVEAEVAPQNVELAPELAATDPALPERA